MSAIPAPATDRHDRWGAAVRCAVTAVIGVVACVAAVVLAQASNKVLVAGVLGMALLPIIVWLQQRAWAPSLVVGVLVFTIPINLDVNLFVRNHTGGAPSITISLTVLALGWFWLTWALRRWRGEVAQTVQVHRAMAWAMAALLAFTPLSLINASHVDLVLLEWFRLLLLGAALFAAMSLRDERLIRLWVFVLSLQVVLQAVLAGSQYLLKRSLGLAIFGEEALVEQNIGHVVNRATGTVGHPNVLSYFFEMLLPVMLALALARQPAPHRLWYTFALFAGLGGVLTTLSRGAWLTLPVSFALVIVLVYGRRIVRVKAMTGVAVIGICLVGVLAFAWPTIEKRFTHDDYKSAQSRMPLNRAAWSIIEKHPVVGVGLNNFAEVFKREDDTGFARIFRGYRHVVHNLHLWIWTEVGVLGLLAYWAPFAIAGVLAWRLRTRAPPVPRAIGVGIAAGLLAHWIHGMVDPGFRVSLAVSFLVFTQFGLMAALALRYPGRKSRPSRLHVGVAT